MLTDADPFAAALLATLDRPGVAERVVAKLAAYLPDMHGPDHSDDWLDTKGAAAYLGITPNALHKRTAARSIRFHQAAPGGKCWFRRGYLDEWREHESPRRFRAASSHGRNAC